MTAPTHQPSPIVARVDPAPGLPAVMHALRVGAILVQAEASPIDLTGPGVGGGRSHACRVS